MFNKMNISASELEIVSFLCQSPGKEWHVRALSKALDISVGSSSQGLRNLESRGFVRSRHVGNLVLYQMATDKPLVRSLKVFLNLMALEPVIEAVKDHSDRIYLYGSAADGSDNENSDLDLLIVSNEKAFVKQKISGFQKDLEHRLSPVIVTPAELVRLSKTDKAFHERSTGGILLWRVEHERV